MPNKMGGMSLISGQIMCLCSVHLAAPYVFLPLMYCLKTETEWFEF
jgi:hypothetical protein